MIPADPRTSEISCLEELSGRKSVTSSQGAGQGPKVIWPEEMTITLSDLCCIKFPSSISPCGIVPFKLSVKTQIKLKTTTQSEKFNDRLHK